LLILFNLGSQRWQPNQEYCAKQFDLADDKKKGLERAVSDLETRISDAKDGIATSQSEIKALGESITALDKSVADATEQRKLTIAWADFYIDLFSENT
jgi:septal ring factor EnvC (AmiA/AmiB activator)